MLNSFWLFRKRFIVHDSIYVWIICPLQVKTPLITVLFLQGMLDIYFHRQSSSLYWCYLSNLWKVAKQPSYSKFCIRRKQYLRDTFSCSNYLPWGENFQVAVQLHWKLEESDQWNKNYRRRVGLGYFITFFYVK